MVLRGVRQRGFTLLEMLVALALMATLAAGLYESLHIGVTARSRAQASIEPVRSASLVLELLKDDIASALPPTGILAGSFIGTDAKGSNSVSDADTLVFYSAVEDSGRARPGTRKIELALATDQDGNANALVRRVTDNLLAPTVPEPSEELLCRDVTSFNLSYYDGTDWFDGWDSTTRDNTLPMAVQVDITIRQAADASGEARGYTLTRVFLLPCWSLPSEQGGATGAPASGQGSSSSTQGSPSSGQGFPSSTQR